MPLALKLLLSASKTIKRSLQSYERSYFIRNRFHFDMHAAYVIIRKSGRVGRNGRAKAMMMVCAMMIWHTLLFAAWFSLSLSLLLFPLHTHIAMASIRIILLLSTISEPQNESQRKTHFRAHFIMKKIYVYCIMYISDSCEKERDSETFRFGKYALSTWQLSLFLLLAYSHAHNFSYFIRHTRSTLNGTLSQKKKKGKTKWRQPTAPVENNRKYEFMPFNIQHAYAHIFMLIIKQKKIRECIVKHLKCMLLFFFLRHHVCYVAFHMCALTYTRFALTYTHGAHSVCKVTQTHIVMYTETKYIRCTIIAKIYFRNIHKHKCAW